MLPAAQRHRGGVPLPIAARIRLDHGALVALMVPPPTRKLVSTIRSILTVHNEREEEIDGLYEASENAIGKTVEELRAMMQNAADVPVLPAQPRPESLRCDAPCSGARRVFDGIDLFSRFLLLFAFFPYISPEKKLLSS